ncbi:MAG: hypothetical protein GTO12_13925 [Proteobacteria bacterium]|nr:hypothetical protein [Pseudomonadota bacterium]
MTEKRAGMTIEQILERERAHEFNFEKLLDPYREGGTKDQPMPRTWGTVVRWLLDKHKFDIETVGAAILLICLEMKGGKTFEGDGSYGSMGHQMVHAIRNTCVQIRERNQAQAVFALMGKKIFGQVEELLAEQIRKQLRPWWKRLF